MFVHLHLHTEYSLIDSVVRIDELMEAVKAAGMPAVAVTDQGNLFAMVKFYKAALSAGVLPIIGCDLLVHEDGERAEPSSLVLLCQNEAGRKNLLRLVTRTYLEGQRDGTPRIERSWLTPDALSGLIALSGGRYGDVGRALLAGDQQRARELLDSWVALLGDRYYLELQRTGRPGEDSYIEGAVGIAAVDPPNGPESRLGVVRARRDAAIHALRHVEFRIVDIAQTAHEREGTNRAIELFPVVTAREPLLQLATMHLPLPYQKIKIVHPGKVLRRGRFRNILGSAHESASANRRYKENDQRLLQMSHAALLTRVVSNLKKA